MNNALSMVLKFRKILFLVHSLPPYEFTGTPIIAFDYAKKLVRRGFKVGVVFPSFEDREYKSFNKVEREEGFRTYEVPFTKEKWIGWSIWDSLNIDNNREQKSGTIFDILLDFNPDLVHIVDNVNLPTEWVNTIKLLGIPIVRQVWNLEDVCGRIEPFIQESLKLCPSPLTVDQCTDCCMQLYKVGPHTDDIHKRREIEQALTKKREHTITNYSLVYDSVIFPSVSVKDFFLKTIPVPAEKIKIINGGLDVPLNNGKINIVEDKSIKFIFIGNLNLRKGISLVSDVFLSPELLQRDDYELLIYGSGDVNLISKLIESNPKVNYGGIYQPSDLSSILKSADIGLSPSYFETFHRVTREYLAYGVPVIGSKAFGIPDIVNDGVNGFIFETGDQNSLKEKVLQILNDKTLLLKLKLSVNKSHIDTVENEVEKIIEIYNQIFQSRFRPSLIFETPFFEILKKTEKENKQLQQKIRQKDTKLQSVESKLLAMQSNLTWQLLNKYVFRVFDKWLLPFGSNRRKLLEKLSKKTLKDETFKIRQVSTVEALPTFKNSMTVKTLEPDKNKFALYTNSNGNYFFHEIRDLIASGLKELGFSVDISNEKSGFNSNADWHIVVAPHEFFYLGEDENLCTELLPRNLILVNTEQPSTQWFSLAANYFPTARFIWDINYDSAIRISEQGFKCDFLPLGFVADSYLFEEVKQLPENYTTSFLKKNIKNKSFFNEPYTSRPIDISFVGCLTPRRDEFFAKAASVISNYHSYIHFSDGLAAPVVPGLTTHMNTEIVLGLMQRSKIMLNIHHGADKYFEWHRVVILGIGQKTLVISEPSVSSPIFQSGIHYVEAKIKDIPDRINYYLSTQSGKKEAEEIIESGYKKLTDECRLTAFLQPLVHRLYITKPQ